jgi:hypothetical protein
VLDACWAYPVRRADRQLSSQSGTDEARDPACLLPRFFAEISFPPPRSDIAATTCRIGGSEGASPAAVKLGPMRMPSSWEWYLQWVT